MKTNLSDEQHAAATSDTDNIVVIAGPGSGKTKTLVARVGHLISGGIDPDDIVIITFTNAAAGEIKRRIQRETSKAIRYVGTIHGLVLKIVEQHHMAAGFTKPPTVITEERRTELVKMSLEALRFEKKTTVETVLKAIRRNPLVNRPMIPKTEDLVAMHYLRTTQGANLIDFDSILTFGCQAILTVGIGLAVSMRYLFVDEVQDCSVQHHEVFTRLGAANLFMVGDPDQSVYGFNGGRPELLVDMATKSTAEVFRLERNYRCPAVVCEGANRLIGHNTMRVPKDTVSDSFGTVQVHRFATQLAEIEDIRRWAMTISHTETMAVLCRTRFDCQRIATYLGQSGVQVEVAQAPELGEAWETGLRMLALLGDMENDLLCFTIFQRQHGTAEAERMQFQASLAGIPMIRQKHTGLGEIVMATLHQVLARLGADQAFVEVAARIVDETPGITLAELQVRMTGGDEQRKEPEPGIMTVSTMHRAKGLEWNHVYLPGWSQPQFPKLGRDDGPEACEEERRLAFVAITRASRSLTLSWAQSGLKSEYDRKPHDLGEPSQFLGEAFPAEMMLIPTEEDL